MANIIEIKAWDVAHFLLDDGSKIVVYRTVDGHGVLVFRDFSKPITIQATRRNEFEVKRAD